MLKHIRIAVAVLALAFSFAFVAGNKDAGHVSPDASMSGWWF